MASHAGVAMRKSENRYDRIPTPALPGSGSRDWTATRLISAGLRQHPLDCGHIIARDRAVVDGGFAIGWQSIIGDYLLAFTVLGLAGLVARRKNGVFTGTLIAGFARFLVHYVVGATIWAAYMPDTFFGLTMHSPWFYSLLYNLAYMLPNIAITLVVFAVAYKPLNKYMTAADIFPSAAADTSKRDPSSPKWNPER